MLCKRLQFSLVLLEINVLYQTRFCLNEKHSNEHLISFYWYCLLQYYNNKTHFFKQSIILINISSLSSGDGGTTTTGTHTTAGNNTTEIQYGPGPSLRPQTEGSWIQGGSRPVSSSIADGPSRSNSSGPLAAPPQLPVQVGQQPLPPQFRGVLPPFVSVFLYQNQPQEKTLRMFKRYKLLLFKF